MTDTGSGARSADNIGFWVVAPRTGEDGTPDIDFQLLKPNPPAAQRELKNEAERALRIINALYHRTADTRKREEAVAKLTALCQVGLVGKEASPSVARDALRALESDIVEREAGPIKNHYMRKLGLWAGGFALASGAAYFFCDHFPSVPFEQIYRYRTMFLLWSGAMVGSWASFASRKIILQFSDLVALEEDRIEPPLRLLFAGILTVILALSFATGVADVTIGDFQASAAMQSGAIAFLLGAFAGLAEKILPSTVMSHATNLLSSAGPRK